MIFKHGWYATLAMCEACYIPAWLPNGVHSAHIPRLIEFINCKIGL
jgi:hypothetical protein